MLVARELGIPEILPDWLGANMALRGFPNLTKLAVGSRILFPSGAGLLCEGENLPCTQPGEIIQARYPDIPKLSTRFVRNALGRRGIICVVERPGKILCRDTAKKCRIPSTKVKPRGHYNCCQRQYYEYITSLTSNPMPAV